MFCWRLGEDLGLSWDCFGSSWAQIGTIWGAVWNNLGSFFRILGSFLGLLGQRWDNINCGNPRAPPVENPQIGTHPGGNQKLERTLGGGHEPQTLVHIYPPAPPLRRGVKAVGFLRYPFGIPPLNLPHGSQKRLLGGVPYFSVPRWSLK